ncbi:MAG: restriction endonuclease subunit S [Cyclobacteriaceae bacterium]
MGSATSSNTTYLQKFQFSNLQNWSVRYLFENAFSYNDQFELIAIGDFLIRNKEIIEIQDGAEYRRVTIKINNNGVFLRDTEKGEKIGTKRQYIVRKGQFILSKIDARNGAFGLIPDELDGAIVTNDFPSFHVDNARINTQFLVLITTTKEFIRFAQSCSSGTTNRQRIDVDLFLQQRIPLPSLVEQERIVFAYLKKLRLAEEQENEIRLIESKLEDYFLKKLGIEKAVSKEKTSGLNTINFKDISIWAIWNLKDAFISRKYESVPLGNILKMKSGSFLPSKKQVKGDYIVYGGNGITGTHNEYILEGKRIVIGRVGELCGNVHLVEGKYWVTDNAFITERLDDDFNYEYLEIILNFLDLNRFRVISAQPSVSQQNLINVPVPKPDINVQNEIVQRVFEFRKTINTLKAEALKNRENAIKNFENEIFQID